MATMGLYEKLFAAILQYYECNNASKCFKLPFLLEFSCGKSIKIVEKFQKKRKIFANFKHL